MNAAFRASVNLNFHWGSVGLRYTFNGKETDSETDLQDYGMRIYNPRLGKFLSVDPLNAYFPSNSPYTFAENDVIGCVDLEGLERFSLTVTKYSDGTVKAIVRLVDINDVSNGVQVDYNGTVRNDFVFKKIQDDLGGVVVSNGILYKPTPDDDPDPNVVVFNGKKYRRASQLGPRDYNNPNPQQTPNPEAKFHYDITN